MSGINVNRIVPGLLIRKVLQEKLQFVPWNGEFTRVSGAVLCHQCGFELYRHPADPHEPDLTVACDGLRYKL